MATFKHISSKNANYGDAEKYLTFAHDEFTMKPTLDTDGRLVPREDYRISTLNCGEEDFAVACMRSNLRYGKNQKREDVKSHHYIISFDPRDGPDNGLTVDKAQELGERFCREQFPGHQAIVCTHPDGHNQSGNIHVHSGMTPLEIYKNMDLGEVHEQYREQYRRITAVDVIYRTLQGKDPCATVAEWDINAAIDELRHKHGDYEEHFRIPSTVKS